MNLPPELLQLIEEGVWPETYEQAIKQNLSSLLGPSEVRQFAEEEERIYLYFPPFPTVWSEMEMNPKSFWFDPRSATHELDPLRSVILGDFGPGSDAAMVLDFRGSLSNPCVMRLRWGAEGNHWVRCFETFSDFAAILRRSQSERIKARILT